jgi:hypothetical protein
MTKYVNRVTPVKCAYGRIAKSIGEIKMAKITVLLIVLFLSFNNESSAALIDVDFNHDNLGNYPIGTNITRQFFDKGLIFSDDPIRLQGGFTSLGWQENRVSNSPFLNNPFRIDFVYPEPVVSVSATMYDGNGMYQIHNLFAFDIFGNIIDWAGFADTTNGGTTVDPFFLTVSSLTPIASVLFYEQNYGQDYGKNGGFGNEKLSHLSYTTKTAAVPEPSIIALFAAGLFGIGLARRRKHI